MSFVMPLTTPHINAALRDAKNGSPEARWVAAQALGSVGDADRNKAIETLYGLLGDPVEEVRAQALEGLAEQMRAGAKIAGENLLKALGDPSGAVRCAAIDAAAQIPGDFTEQIALLLTDEDPSVRAVAATVLGELQAPNSSDHIASLLEDSVGFVKTKAAMALAALGDSRGTPVLLSLLEEDADTAYDAILALGHLGNDTLSPQFEKLTSRFFVSAPLKAVAAAAMVRCNAPRGKEILDSMMTSRFRSTRMAVLATLSRMPITGMAASVGHLMDKNNPVEASSSIQTLSALNRVDADACRKEMERRLGKLRTKELNDELSEAIALCNQR
jgi:HEAT repeat protein